MRSCYIAAIIRIYFSKMQTNCNDIKGGFVNVLNFIAVYTSFHVHIFALNIITRIFQINFFHYFQTAKETTISRINS